MPENVCCLFLRRVGEGPLGVRKMTLPRWADHGEQREGLQEGGREAGSAAGSLGFQTRRWVLSQH